VRTGLRATCRPSRRRSPNCPPSSPVSPPPADWPPDRVASFHREYNGHLLRNLTVHEAMPGPVLRFAHAARHRAATRVRRALTSDPFIEGRTGYAEELMATHGLGDDGTAAALRMQQLKMQLRSTINAVLDVRVHALGMTGTEAMRLMVERGHAEDGEAVGTWRRALLISAQLVTYYVGYHEVRAVVRGLREARSSASERTLHDAVFSHGSPPPGYLRELLGLR
jgi:uncharacterized protein (DUF885 family)